MTWRTRPEADVDTTVTVSAIDARGNRIIEQVSALVTVTPGQTTREEMNLREEAGERAFPERIEREAAERAERERIERESHLEEFRRLAGSFLGASLRVRIDVDQEMTRVAPAIEVNDLLEFAQSGHEGERAGAAIGLGIHLKSAPRVLRDPGIETTLRDLLNDPQPRIRYRAVRSLRGLPPSQIRYFEKDVRRLANDRDSHVRNMANDVLSRLGRLGQ